MKHIGKFLSLLVCIITAVGTLIACGSAGCSSTGYSGDGWYRPDYSKEMEARDDEKGREHIEIPNDATTIELDGEEYNVVRKRNDFNREKNNILANDIEFGRFDIIGYKFNGNNYKLYGETGNESIFRTIENATIENVIFSSTMLFAGSSFNALIKTASNSIIRDCINYYSTALHETTRLGGGPIIREAYNCTIENVINYGDMRSCSGICADAFDGTIITDCVNYGNLSYSDEKHYDSYSNFDYSIGGIAGRIRGDVQIENCTNYGNIIGKVFCGGIVGFNANEANRIYEAISYKATENYSDGQIIENCENYGNIYLKLESGANQISHAQNPTYSRYYKEFEKLKWHDLGGIWYDAGANITGIGGIAGFASKIRNCKNHGAFYGFNKLEDDLYVDYCGGIAGIAREITDCETDYTIDNIQKGRALNVGDLVGYIFDEDN